MPPPIPVTQAVEGLKWSSKDSGGAVYLTPTQNLAMKSALITETMKKKYKEEVPSDYSNPAVSTEKLNVCKVQLNVCSNQHEGNVPKMVHEET